MNYNKNPFIIKSYYVCGISLGKIESLDEQAGGIVFYPILNAKTIGFTLLSDVYCQFGTCDYNASIPTVMTTGAGRGLFNATSKAGNYTISTNGEAGCFFIGGKKGMLISNIHITEYV